MIASKSDSTKVVATDQWRPNEDRELEVSGSLLRNRFVLGLRRHGRR
jgi:hypothetical protein